LWIVAIAVPLLPTARPQPAIDLGARARLAALDGFDSRARPASIVYDRLRKGAATDALPQLILGVKAGQRSDKQPVRVIHNGRFSLPAGNYTITVQFNDHAAGGALPLSLQIGRNGPSLQTWMVQPQPGQQFQTPLWLPVDASFVGLRGPVELERAVASMTITPVTVVDAGARPLVPIVLAAAAYSGATLFFHDEQLYPEPNGFWTLGAGASHVTFAVPPNHAARVVLRMHPGAVENNVTLSTFGWQRSFRMVPGEAVEVELPSVDSGVVPLTIDADSGFYPQDVDPNSRDRRFLGIWVEVTNKKAPTP